MIYTNTAKLIKQYGGYWIKDYYKSRGLQDLVSGKGVGVVSANASRPVGIETDSYAWQSTGYNVFLDFKVPNMIPNDDFSIRFKVKTHNSPHGAPTIVSPIFSTINSAGNSGMVIAVNHTGHLTGYSRIKNSDNSINEEMNRFGGLSKELYIGDFLWHDVLFVKEKTKITVYVDNFKKPAYTINRNIEPYRHSGFLQAISSRHNMGSIYFGGMIDDIQIYHKAIHPIDLELESYYYTNSEGNVFSVVGDTKYSFTETKENISNYGFNISQEKVASTKDVIQERIFTAEEKFKKRVYVVEEKTATDNGQIFKHKIDKFFNTISLPDNK